jgi:sugar phosphate isomerase/epimerase
MKLGLESFSARNSGLDPIGVLDLAAELGLQGVLFELSPFRSFRDGDLAAIRGRAETLGMYLHFGMGSIFHWHPMAEQGRQLLAGAGYDVNVSEAAVVVHHLHVAKKLGSPILRCVGGNLFTRDEGHDMTALADRAVEILREACKAAEDLELKIAIENHANFTARELASIWARVNSPALGFTLDTANVAFDLDDPVRVASILAPHALATHFKDYRIVRTDRGVALENTYAGGGDIDLRAIVGMAVAHNPNLCLSIEVHSQYAPFRLDFLEPGYFGRHPAPPGDGLAWFLRQSWDRPVVGPNDYETLPDGPASWAVERDHIERGARWAKENLASFLA